MAKDTSKYIKILNGLQPAAADKVLTVTGFVYDNAAERFQSDINTSVLNVVDNLDRVDESDMKNVFGANYKEPVIET